MTRRTLLYALAVGGLLTASCAGDTLVHRYATLPADGWARHDTVCFDLPGHVEDICGTLTVGLRTKTGVAIRDIVLAVEQCDSDAFVIRRDTVCYPLTDSEGDALTSGVNFHQYETQFVPFHMEKDRKGCVRIYHLMTRETIPGITEVGIRIRNKED